MGCTSSANSPRESTFQPILDQFKSIEEVQLALRNAGLESSNLIIGVDFTKSNTWTGRETFHGRCLHDIAENDPYNQCMNPYERVIQVMGETLEDFDDDKIIPAFGFGDARTGDRGCFEFSHSPCEGFHQVLHRYREIASSVKLAGPTSFGPVIREAIRIVQSEQSYHILVIIADGQVTDSSPNGDTAQAIVEASNYPLSIVVVGVGDGPWGAMEHYDDALPQRKFDNLQFVEFNRLLSLDLASPTSSNRMQAQFALNALMEIPDQYKFIKKAGMLNRPGRAPRTAPLAAAFYHSPSAPPSLGELPPYSGG